MSTDVSTPETSSLPETRPLHPSEAEIEAVLALPEHVRKLLERHGPGWGILDTAEAGRVVVLACCLDSHVDSAVSLTGQWATGYKALAWLPANPLHILEAVWPECPSKDQLLRIESAEVRSEVRWQASAFAYPSEGTAYGWGSTPRLAALTALRSSLGER